MADVEEEEKSVMINVTEATKTELPPDMVFGEAQVSK